MPRPVHASFTPCRVGDRKVNWQTNSTFWSAQGARAATRMMRKRMWTLMVWMYQYQQTASDFPYMVMAAFVLASIPTLLVFVFCQRIILRGIIIPTMK